MIMGPRGVSVLMAMSSEVKVSIVLRLMCCLTAMAMPSLLTFVLLDVYMLYLKCFTVCGCLSECEFTMSGLWCLYWLLSSCLSLYRHESMLCCMIVRCEGNVLCVAAMVSFGCAVAAIM